MALNVFAEPEPENWVQSGAGRDPRARESSWQAARSPVLLRVAGYLPVREFIGMKSYIGYLSHTVTDREVRDGIVLEHGPARVASLLHSASEAGDGQVSDAFALSHSIPSPSLL